MSAEPSAIAAKSALLTTRQVLELLCISRGTLVYHTNQGHIRPVKSIDPSLKKTISVRQNVYSRADVEALVPFMQEGYRQRRLQAGEVDYRTCKKCSYRKPITEFGFVTNKNGNTLPIWDCKACRKEHCRKFRRENSDHCRAYRQGKKAEIADYGRQYEQENKERLSAVRKRGVHIKQAILDGKSSPIHKIHGFSIARNAEGVYRAARMDKPLNPGESALVRYEFNCNVWCVLPVPVRGPDSEQITEWCLRYEARIAQRTQRNKAKKAKAETPLV